MDSSTKCMGMWCGRNGVHAGHELQIVILQIVIHTQHIKHTHHADFDVVCNHAPSFSPSGALLLVYLYHIQLCQVT